MTLFEKPLEELKSFFNLNDPLEKSMDKEDEEKKKKEENKEEEKTEKSFDPNVFVEKADTFFKSIQDKVDKELEDLKKSLSENHGKTDAGFEKLVKSLEDVTKAVDQSIESTKSELSKSLEDIKTDFDTRLKKLEDTPNVKKSVEAVERFKNQESAGGEELSKSVITTRMASLFKKGIVNEHDVAFWDVNKKLGLKVLPEPVQKAIREYKD